MDFKEEDFPVYQQLVKLGGPGVRRAMADFEAAVNGGDEEKYNFALGIQTIAANVPVGDIPGVTKEMNDRTLRSCFVVFVDLASRGHTDAAYMVQDFKMRGLGQPLQLAPGRPKFNF
jgi:hypothetical protein